MSSNLKTFVFAIIMCLITSFLLTSAYEQLKDRIATNIKIDKQKHILNVLEEIPPSKESISNDQISKLYANKIKEYHIDKKGKISTIKSELSSPLFVVEDNNKNIQKYAIPISGYGLWSTLYGFLSLKGDGKTVLGFTIYDHKETPGLGAECEKPWFKNQFKNKSILDENGVFVSIGVAKGKYKTRQPASKWNNYVDGMSGATITSKGIETFLKNDLEKYEVFSKKIREQSKGDL